eukprot:1141755-Lingulodinium_polyedra.AAC.1
MVDGLLQRHAVRAATVPPLLDAPNGDHLIHHQPGPHLRVHVDAQGLARIVCIVHLGHVLRLLLQDLR